eukprot:CAMPEP_0194707446 /NCGR_PEP_ID=MMETSP0296-20130528/137_1 /TAXON_ID=39354 /ORGANISM="Heterosigma akashiwo, Strain CCMP2393" /LENGTH=82 /DNA_ID=CAMNT_0039603617 /DNA_START=150 /DNA_END=398 /DNA_ORIENTATION=-
MSLLYGITCNEILVQHNQVSVPTSLKFSSVKNITADVAREAYGLLHSESGGVGAMAHFPTNLVLPMAAPPEAGAALHWASAG